MKLQRLMAEVREKLTELNTEMDCLGFGWIVCNRSIEKAFGDIDHEVEQRHLTKKSRINKKDGKNMKKIGDFMLLPPAPDVCQECATKHEPEEPHNKQSLYYQYSFYAEHGRWPDWFDAMNHCSEEMKAAWTAELKKHGVELLKGGG